MLENILEAYRVKLEEAIRYILDENGPIRPRTMCAKTRFADEEDWRECNKKYINMLLHEIPEIIIRNLGG